MLVKSRPFAFQCSIRLSRSQFVRATDHFVDGAETEFGHDLAQFRRDEPHEIDQWSGLPVKSLRSCGSCVATPTGQVFKWHNAHHETAEHDERRGRKSEFLRAEQRGDRHRRGPS